MRSIQQLHDAADKERQKADGLRGESQKQRLKAQDSMDNPNIALVAANESQKDEEKAALHDQQAAKLLAEATDLEARALEINRRKNEIQANAQAQIDQLDREEKALRGEARGMF